jgi:hypothetical protein
VSRRTIDLELPGEDQNAVPEILRAGTEHPTRMILWAAGLSHCLPHASGDHDFGYDRGMPVSVNVQTVHPRKLAAVRREVAPESPAWFDHSWLPVREALTNACNNVDVHQRVHGVVHLYSVPIKKTLDEDEQADVWFVVVPDLVYERCRPKSVVPRGLQVKLPTRLSSGMAKKLRAEVSMFDELNEDVVPYKFQPHFRNQLKAVLLDSNIPTQVVRESTLAPYDFLNKFGYHAAGWEGRPRLRGT